MEEIEIPFIGSAGVTNNITPDQVADWIEPQDKVPLLLALSLYDTPRQTLNEYTLIPNTYKTRSAAWFDPATGTTIVGLRGTSVFGKYSTEDIKDDTIIAGFGTNYCNLSLVKEAKETIDQLVNQSTLLVFSGHSLGGTGKLFLDSLQPHFALPPCTLLPDPYHSTVGLPPVILCSLVQDLDELRFIMSLEI